MLKKTLLAAAAAVVISTPALASHCPADARAIEAALAASDLGDAAKAEIIALKEQGMTLHSAGNHGEAEKVLADAMRRLLEGFAS